MTDEQADAMEELGAAPTPPVRRPKCVRVQFDPVAVVYLFEMDDGTIVRVNPDELAPRRRLERDHFEELVERRYREVREAQR